MPRGCLHSESYGPEGAVTLFGRKIADGATARLRECE